GSEQDMYIGRCDRSQSCPIADTAGDHRGVSMSQDEQRRVAGIRDVAKAAGVSRQTVSRVINNHPSLRPETRERVLAVIEELNYRPNRIARALGTRRTQTIGVITSLRLHYGPAAALI